MIFGLVLSLYGVPPILPMTYTETPIRLTKRELFSATPRVWETKCLVFVESVSMMCTYWLSGRARRKDICLEVMTQRLSAARSVRQTKTNNKETQIIKTESTFWATSRSIHPRVLRHWEVQLGNTEGIIFFYHFLFVCLSIGSHQQPWRIPATISTRFLGRLLVGTCYYDNCGVRIFFWGKLFLVDLTFM